MTAMVKVIIHTKGKNLRDKVMSVTRKCYELKDQFPCFSWEFHNYNGRLCFSASHWSGEVGEKFEFPLHLAEVDDRYKYIMDQLNELKWSALFYEREENNG